MIIGGIAGLHAGSKDRRIFMPRYAIGLRAPLPAGSEHDRGERDQQRRRQYRQRDVHP
jgi:hypothetical protein